MDSGVPMWPLRFQMLPRPPVELDSSARVVSRDMEPRVWGAVGDSWVGSKAF